MNNKLKAVIYSYNKYYGPLISMSYFSDGVLLSFKYTEGFVKNKYFSD